MTETFGCQDCNYTEIFASWKDFRQHFFSVHQVKPTSVPSLWSENRSKTGQYPAILSPSGHPVGVALTYSVRLSSPGRALIGVWLPISPNEASNHVIEVDIRALPAILSDIEILPESALKHHFGWEFEEKAKLTPSTASIEDLI